MSSTQLTSRSRHAKLPTGLQKNKKIMKRSCTGFQDVIEAVRNFRSDRHTWHQKLHEGHLHWTLLAGMGQVQWQFGGTGHPPPAATKRGAPAQQIEEKSLPKLFGKN